MLKFFLLLITVVHCAPFVHGSEELVKDLNCNNDLYKFVRTRRERFQIATISGTLWYIFSLPVLFQKRMSTLMELQSCQRFQVQEYWAWQSLMNLTPPSVYVRQWNFTANFFLCSYKSQRSELTVNIYDRIVLSSLPMLLLLNK